MTHGGVFCSFCGKSQREVSKLIAGPTVYTCDECVKLSDEIIAAETPPKPRFRVRQDGWIRRINPRRRWPRYPLLNGRVELLLQQGLRHVPLISRVGQPHRRIGAKRKRLLCRGATRVPAEGVFIRQCRPPAGLT